MVKDGRSERKKTGKLPRSSKCRVLTQRDTRAADTGDLEPTRLALSLFSLVSHEQEERVENGEWVREDGYDCVPTLADFRIQMLQDAKFLNYQYRHPD